jgi:23S rRNA pseudouridine1911/1915/1917 synthase
MPTIRLVVDANGAGQRVDSYLAQAGIGLSRSQIKRLFGEKRVTVVGKWVRVSHLVSEGEEIIIDQPDEKRIEFLAEDLPVDIVYEDDDLAVVNKAAGMVTHPAHLNRTGTLANALLHHFAKLSTGYAKGYPGLVHRLDKNTSGLLVVAKNDRIHANLSAQLQQRTLKREYLALVWGTLRPPEGTISIPIGRSRADRRIMTSGSLKPREAVTLYQTIESWGWISYISVNLMTGRTHQIRTHLKEFGHPVFGDPEYGGRATRLTGIEAGHRLAARQMLVMTSRQLLHATRIEFTHPSTGKRVEFRAELPEDFRQVLELVRLNH